MDPHPKFGSDVETDKATHTPKRYKKFCYSHNETFRVAPKQVQNGLKKQGKETGLEVLWWLGDGDCVKVPVNGLIFPLILKERTPRHSYQLA